jgi:hypothetical protein
MTAVSGKHGTFTFRSPSELLDAENKLTLVLNIDKCLPVDTV